MSSSVLTLNDVAVRRGDRLILGPINFSISHGERWVVLGPNGAGKSTLLQILATKIFPTQGSVFVLDKQMGKVDLFELRMLYLLLPMQFLVAGTKVMIYGMNLALWRC
jgi:iron complex transport system ATP-binding protein